MKQQKVSHGEGAGWGTLRVQFAQSSISSQPLLLSQALTLSLNVYMSFQYIGAGEMLIGCVKCSEEKRE